MKRRYRNPVAKSGEIRVQWGRDPDMGESLIYWNGVDPDQPADKPQAEHLTARKVDINLLMTAFESTEVLGASHVSLMKELEDRGYDLRTMKFSIRKKQPE